MTKEDNNYKELKKLTNKLCETITNAVDKLDNNLKEIDTHLGYINYNLGRK